MKLNGILLLILISLGVFTYYFQELGDRQRAMEAETKGLVFDPQKLGGLTGIKTPQVMIQKVGNGFMIGEHMIIVDKDRLEKVFSILSKIKIKRVLQNFDSSKRKFFFPNEDNKFHFYFDKGDVQFLLGAKLAHSREFYVEIQSGGKTQQVIAFDASPVEGTYSPEQAHRLDNQYRRLSALLHIKESFFYDTQVFKKQKLGSNFLIESMQVENIRNKSFSVDFKLRKTNPMPPGDISLDEKYIEKVLGDLAALKAETLYYPFRKENLKDKLSTVKLGGRKNFSLKLYRKNGSLEGYFLTGNHDDALFELKQEMAGIFFSNVQDFWDLRPTGPMVLSELKISFKDKWYHVQNVPGESFHVRNLDGNKREPRHKAFQKLWDLLATRAQRLSYLDKKAQVGAKLFSVKFGNRIFHVKLVDGELRLINLQDGYELIYLVGDDVPVEKTMNDYFL